MKRYSMYATIYAGVDPEEDPVGEWVKYDDGVAPEEDPVGEWVKYKDICNITVSCANCGNDYALKDTEVLSSKLGTRICVDCLEIK